jgi:hypothetical protein
MRGRGRPSANTGRPSPNTRLLNNYKLSAEHAMQKIEFKTVSYEISLGKRLSGDDFGDSFLRLLSDHGQEGWDLKGIIRESGMQTLLIFSRSSV